MHLRTSPYGGTTAVVLLPTALLHGGAAERSPGKAVDPDGAGSQPTATTHVGYDGQDAVLDLDGSNALTTRRLDLPGVDQEVARVSALRGRARRK